MCNAISPEKAVMWTLLFEGGVDPSLCAEHFTHESYRRWFGVLASIDGGPEVSPGPVSERDFLDAAAALGHTLEHLEQRALQRMLRVPPPPRVQANRALLVQALSDRHTGKRVHIERLIN